MDLRTAGVNGLWLDAGGGCGGGARLLFGTAVADDEDDIKECGSCE